MILNCSVRQCFYPEMRKQEVIKRDVEILLRGAESFIKDALEDLKRGDSDLAMFHVEQACQPRRKSKAPRPNRILRKIHSLRRLLKDLSTIDERAELDRFVDEKWTTLRNLEFAYVAAHYLEFRESEVEEALELYRTLRELLWTS